MPRVPRFVPPAALVHVICRLVDGRFLFDDWARQEYLARLHRSLLRCDWQLLAYALMSNHVHLALVSGRDSLQHWIQPLHGSIAQWINRRRRRGAPKTLGHVFAQRPTTQLFGLEHAGIVIAYVHNNPGRAGATSNPLQSDWTSHRAYVGRAPAPPWLGVELGLTLCGFAADGPGRRAFHAFVCGRALHPRTIDHLERGPLGSGRAPKAASAAGLLIQSHPPSSPHAGPGVREVLDHVADFTALSPQALCDGGRTRAAVRARCIALRVWERLGHTRTAMCLQLGVSSAAASQTLKRNQHAPTDAAVATIVARLTEGTRPNLLTFARANQPRAALALAPAPEKLKS